MNENKKSNNHDCVSRQSLLNKLDPLYEEKIKTAPDNMAEGFTQVSALIKREPPVTPIFIPNEATNGDVIMAMFPHAKIRTNYYTYYVEVKLEYHSQYDTGLLFDKEWWNAPYQQIKKKNKV